MASLSRYSAPLPETDALAGVFAFLDAALPEDLRRAAEEKDFGIGRVDPCDEAFFIAKILNSHFRLQWSKCPIRGFLAQYRLYYRDDMAAALTSAYSLHKQGGDPEQALRGDYAMGFHGLLYHLDIDEFRNAPQDSYKGRYWSQFRSQYESGDRLVEYRWLPYDGYLLVRGDRLVWEEESIHKCRVGVSLKWNAEVEHFEALGGSKAFLNGQFVWPPPGWVNPVSDEEERASLNKRPMFDLKTKT